MTSKGVGVKGQLLIVENEFETIYFPLVFRKRNMTMRPFYNINYETFGQLNFLYVLLYVFAKNVTKGDFNSS